MRYPMEPMHALTLLGAVAASLIAALFYAKEQFAKGRLSGIQETVFEMARGASVHYEHEGQEIPEGVADAVDKTRMRA